MFIIVENNKITGIEKNLLNDLNITLESISEFINTLELQIASLTDSQLNINNKTFNVNEIEIISTKNIKIFKLKEVSNSKLEVKEEPSLNPDDLLTTPKEDISTEKNSEKEKENIEEEPTTDSLDFSNQEPLKEPLKQNEINLGEESEEIEISFEDDLDEIKEILELSTAEFNKLIEEELQKASNELGIDIKDLRDWYLQLLEQIQEEKSTIYKNIKKADYDALHKNYHKLKGAALNLRLSKIAIILKKLDELSKDKEDINKIKKITDDFYLLFENKTKTSSQEKDEITPIKNNFLEKIIIQTIQTYLKTQDEERFKKDKKYIEKVLGQKIESIEDLQKFVKGI
jgi:HPt (histidine-containing phosphotransfer) domain-containing protein